MKVPRSTFYVASSKEQGAGSRYQVARAVCHALVVALVLTLLLLSGVALAQTGGVVSSLDTGYTLTWWTADGGGGLVSGGSYLLMGTAGQPEAHVALAGGGYTLAGGFWPGAGPTRHRLHLPLTLRAFIGDW